MQIKDWWCTAGSPLVFVEHGPDETSVPRFATKVELTGHRSKSITLSFCRIRFSDYQEIGTWFLGYNKVDMELASSLRRYLVRVHAERECLKVVLSMLMNESIHLSRGSPQSVRLLRYLTETSGTLRQAFDGIPAKPEDIRTAAYGLDGLFRDEERDELVSSLAYLENDVRSKSLELFEANVSETPPTYTVYHFQGNQTIVQRGGYMGDNMLNIGGDVKGNAVVANAINSSLNGTRVRIAESETHDDLKNALEKLTTTVQDLIQRLPSDQAAVVARDLDSLTSEAIAIEPRRRWYELSADSLVRAASSFADLAGPLSEAVAEVMKHLP